MANGLMNLQNLLGQSNNAGGLIGGGIFSQPMSRGQRRAGLLNQAISSQGSDPYARLGAAFGGLIGMGGRAAAEGLGIVGKPQEVQRNEAIRQVQQEVADLGLDPMSNPVEFGELVTSRFQELGQPELALRTQLQVRQMMPEGSETSRVIRGGTELGNAAGLAEGESAIGTFDAQGNLSGIKDRTQTSGQPEISNVRDIETEDRGTVTVGTVNNRLVELTPEGPVPFEGDRDIEEDERFTARNISLPNVGTVIGQVDRQGRVFYRGQDVTSQAQFAPQRVEQGEPGAFEATEGQEFDLRESRAQARTFARNAEDAVALLEQNPDINTFVAKGASVINDLEQEAKALARASGVEFNEDILDPTQYGEQFSDLGVNNRRLQGLVTNLAFSAAAAQGQTGRAVSNRDIERFIGEIGASASNPESFAATLRDSVNRTVRGLRIRSREILGEDLGEDIRFMGEPIGLSQEEIQERQSGVSRQQALDLIPSGATLGRQNPETGSWEVYKDGKMIGEIRPD